MENPIVKYGLYYALVSILIALTYYFIAPQMLSGGWISFIVSLLIVITFIVLVTKEIKDNSEDGLLSYGGAFKASFLVILIGGVIYSLFYYVLVNFIDPGLLDFMKESTIESTKTFMEMFGAPEEAIEEAIAKLEEEEMTYGLSKVLSGIVGIAFFSAIVSLITSIFTKRSA